MQEILERLKEGDAGLYTKIVLLYQNEVYAAFVSQGYGEEEAVELSVDAFRDLFYVILKKYEGQDAEKFCTGFLEKKLGNAGGSIFSETLQSDQAQEAPPQLIRKLLVILSQREARRGLKKIIGSAVALVICIALLIFLAPDATEQTPQASFSIIEVEKSAGVNVQQFYQVYGAGGVLSRTSERDNEQSLFRLWRAGEIVNEFSLPSSYKYFSSDSSGKYFIFGNEDIIKVDVQGQIVASLSVAPSSVVEDGIGNVMGVNCGEHYYVVDIKNFEVRQKHAGRIIAISEDGAVLHTGLGDTSGIRVVGVSKYSTIDDARFFPGTSDAYTLITNGRQAACVKDERKTTWDLRGRTNEVTWLPAYTDITGNRVIAGFCSDYSGRIHIFDRFSGNEMLFARTNPVTGMSVSGNGRFLIVHTRHFHPQNPSLEWNRLDCYEIWGEDIVSAHVPFTSNYLIFDSEIEMHDGKYYVYTANAHRDVSVYMIED